MGMQHSKTSNQAAAPAPFAADAAMRAAAAPKA
jgi:hypothetical protein